MSEDQVQVLNQAQAAVSDPDDPLSPVSPEHKQNALPLLITAFCWGFLATGMIVGGNLITKTDTASFLWITFFGNLTSLAIGCGVGYVGYKTALNSGLMFQLTYGRLGAWLPVVMIVLMASGWHAVVAGAIGYTWTNENAGTLYLLAASAAGLLITFSTYFGIKGIEKISVPAAVALLVTGVYSLFGQIADAGGWGEFSAAADAASDGSITNLEGLSLVVGSWIVGAVVMSEYTRFAKRTWVALAFPFVALMLAQWFMQILGAVSTIVMQSYDFTVFLKQQGALFGAMGIIAMTLALWTSGNANLYFPVIQSAVVSQRSPRVMTLVLGLFGTLLAFGVYAYFESFISLLANIVPPLVGPVLAKFYLCQRMDVSRFSDPTAAAPGWVAVLAYFLGAGSTLVSPDFMMPSLTGLLVAMFVYWLLAQFTTPKQAAQESSVL
ncbi:permease, cytosine/purine, uracil, thiamine, allantoin family [Luminiphilus syltensis NOR5-1B]|uniref:Permease, cytosine/purine, uracil, thiamine, allantoin family n=1 Tax=Luminiphilus syltensis NOR5-1B TaxID=565045 RepID=B8KTJ1_9GAMM|nr:permease cytosine/purine uracil thiamine allantoin family [Luminiphilus syltensis]EED36256.1 permease, cytosine/purine, uracil, thiamine, allantoin family [Luminiphilus syltensis NOR5-1B]